MWDCPCLGREKDQVDASARNNDEALSTAYEEGWFRPCLYCDTMTANCVSYIVLIRNDYDQFTVHLCKRCRRVPDPFALKYTHEYDAHTIVRVVTL